MITIDQLLESVDLDFEPKFVTKDGNGDVYIFEDTPEIYKPSKQWTTTVFASGLAGYEGLKLAEFDGKDWTECIYEVPRKVVVSKMEITSKIEKIDMPDRPIDSLADICLVINEIIKKQNELVDAVNELMGNKQPTSNPQATHKQRGAKNE